MLLKILFSLAPVAIILIVSELLWRKEIVKGERARKFIHILAGSWIAFWPFYISFEAIGLLGLVALIVLLYSRIAHLFHGIYAVQRRTYGELLFAAAIIVCAMLGQEPWIFTASILFLSLADGIAAVVGRFWGITNQYLVFGMRALRKSRAGTAAYFVITYAILAVVWLIGGADVMRENIVTVFVIVPVIATILENIGPYGTDNVLTPLFVTLIFNSLL